MSQIIPIPTSRVGDSFARRRLSEQIGLDQLALFRLQNQVSTGQRIQLPSEDAPAALRAINLQRLLDRKGQVRTNLKASNQYISAAWDRLGFVSNELSRLRGEVVGVSGTVVTESAREAVIQQIDGLMGELLSAGNAKYQGRHLFAGSRSQVAPYEQNGKFIEYFGNDGVLRSYVDLERLFETNLSGSEVLGGVSAAMEGSVNLDPHVSAQTLVSSINGGTGLGSNPAISIAITSGGTTSPYIVDLSGAVTLGDVARLIETGMPEDAEVTVEVTSTGLVLRTDTPGVSISVSEVAQGRTARQLGIVSDPNVPASNTIVGDDLNPAVLKTTRLTDLLGTKAQARVEFTGSSNNDLLVTAAQNGNDFNGTIEFVTTGVPGTVSYAGGTLTVVIQKGVTTANDVAAAINLEGTFTAINDYHDTTSSAQAGTGAINFAGPTLTFNATGGGGEALDTTSGLILTNGGQSVTLDISDAETVEELLNMISGADIGLSGEINAAGNGINVRSRLSGADFTIGENGGLTATQLGIRTYTGATELSAFNRGIGVPTNSNPANNDLLITARDGTSFAVNLSTARDVDDVISLINAATGGITVVARLAATGNGIELIDNTTGPMGDESLRVSAVEGSQAAEYLGFVAAGQTEATGTTVGATSVLQSADRHTLEVDSVFNTLLRLRTALEEGDLTEIGRSLERIDTDMDRVNFARAELGGRLQNLEIIDVRLEDENVELQAALSEDLDVDLVQAISELTARQYAFEASLRTAGSLMQMSLLNFI